MKPTYEQLEYELGNLYATVFGDGGHRQAELDALGPFTAADCDPSDIFNTTPSHMPRRYAAALDAIYAKTLRAEAAERQLATAAKYRHLLVMALLHSLPEKTVCGLGD